MMSSIERLDTFIQTPHLHQHLVLCKTFLLNIIAVVIYHHIKRLLPITHSNWMSPRLLLVFYLFSVNIFFSSKEERFSNSTIVRYSNKHKIKGIIAFCVNLRAHLAKKGHIEAKYILWRIEVAPFNCHGCLYIGCNKNGISNNIQYLVDDWLTH